MIKSLWVVGGFRIGGVLVCSGTMGSSGGVIGGSGKYFPSSVVLAWWVYRQTRPTPPWLIKSHSTQCLMRPPSPLHATIHVSTFRLLPSIAPSSHHPPREVGMWVFVLWSLAMFLSPIPCPRSCTSRSCMYSIGSKSEASQWSSAKAVYIRESWPSDTQYTSGKQLTEIA